VTSNKREEGHERRRGSGNKMQDLKRMRHRYMKTERERERVKILIWVCEDSENTGCGERKREGGVAIYYALNCLITPPHKLCHVMPHK